MARGAPPRAHGGDDRDDGELVRAVREGDEEAYGVLWARHVDAARRQAARIAAPREVDDLVSESFAKVFQAVLDGGGPDTAFRAYLFSTLRRLHVDTGRRYHARVVLTDDENDLDGAGGDSPEDLFAERVEGEAAVAAWRSLPEDSRTLLWHLVVSEKSPSEVAPQLGVSPNAVASRAKRARERLRQAFLVELLATAPDEQCRGVRKLLGGYVRGALGDRDRDRVDAHLPGCRGCRAALAEVSDTDATLRRVVAPALLSHGVGDGPGAGGSTPGTSGGSAGAGGHGGVGGAHLAAHHVGPTVLAIATNPTTLVGFGIAAVAAAAAVAVTLVGGLGGAPAQIEPAPARSVASTSSATTGGPAIDSARSTPSTSTSTTASSGPAATTTGAATVAVPLGRAPLAGERAPVGPVVGEASARTSSSGPSSGPSTEPSSGATTPVTTPSGPPTSTQGIQPTTSVTRPPTDPATSTRTFFTLPRQPTTTTGP